jgi:hypothetical protein
MIEDLNAGGCGGAGVHVVKLTPTKKLSRGAAKLISSIKQKKDGSVEIEMRSQDKAIELLGRACGVFKDVKELSGPGGAPLQVQPVPALQTLSNEALEDILRKRGLPLPPRTIEGGNAQ